ncbi:hypothetical protein HCH_04957 [Hahella chejuensis KCTC 2396]|uniref:Uncharacterized protein n=1 Tax=Hahella chejuensis (strain KCTC 2396) TaxID=349521 RepID=Q2SCH8_HAHCH|nr:hypothetical protein HCH_04957 [Hahella chejuensis KCTC 2396]
MGLSRQPFLLLKTTEVEKNFKSVGRGYGNQEAGGD